MTSLHDSIHNPHAMLVSNEREGVKSMLLTLKGIETRLRQNGHSTTFSEDGIYLTYGNAKVNCESTLKVEQLLRAFKKRMNEEIEGDAKKTTAKQPRGRACTPVPSPSDWQESNISRHATDGLGWDMKVAAVVGKRERVTSRIQLPAGEERVDDKQDVTSIPEPPDASKLASDGNMSDSVHEEIGEDKHEVASLPVPPDVTRTADAMDEPEIASPPQEKPRVKLPPPVVKTFLSDIQQKLRQLYSDPLAKDIADARQERSQKATAATYDQMPHVLVHKTLLSEINQTLGQIDGEPLAKDFAAARQEEPQEAVAPTYDQMPHVLIQQQQARIEQLEEELKQANAARLAAEDRTRELEEEAFPAVSGARERVNVKIKDQAEDILKLTLNDQIMEQHPERIAKAIAELQVVYSRRLQKLDRTTNSIWKTLTNFREGRKTAAEDFAQMQNTVERHDSEWLPKLADRVSVIGTDLKALWAALHDYAPSDSASGSSSP